MFTLQFPCSVVCTSVLDAAFTEKMVFLEVDPVEGGFSFLGASSGMLFESQII